MKNLIQYIKYSNSNPNRIVQTNRTELVIRKESSVGISWSYSSKSMNSLLHALFGNRQIGYRVAAWNCRKGLLNPDGSQSNKITDIQKYLQKHQLHMFGIIESDLHGVNSRMRRRNPLSTKDIHKKLHIIIPQSWYSYDQARVIAYVKDGENKLS